MKEELEEIIAQAETIKAGNCSHVGCDRITVLANRLLEEYYTPFAPRISGVIRDVIPRDQPKTIEWLKEELARIVFRLGSLQISFSNHIAEHHSGGRNCP